MERINVYIDGENFHHGMKSINKKCSDFYFDFEKYIKEITKGKKLVDVYYVNAPLKMHLNKIPYRKQQLMHSRLEKAGYKVILCKRKKRIDSNGNETHKMKEDDIRVALQMQKDAYDNKFDVAYLFSGDGDFAPLPEYLKEKGKKMKVFYFKGTESLALLRACDFKCKEMGKKVAYKNFSKQAYQDWLDAEQQNSENDI